MNVNAYAVELENVSLVRNGARILDDISIRIGITESVAVIGPNGSGKTSLMRLLKGDVRPYTNDGTICRLFGEDRWNIFDLRNRMGVVSGELQSRFGGNMTAGAAILSGFFRTADVYRDHVITPEMLTAAADAAARTGIHDKMDRTMSKLSLGEMRRVMIARALVPDPGMLLLDEPMAGLDIIMKKQFRDMLDSLIDNRMSIIMITHDLEDIPLGVRRVIMMKDGRIYADGKKEQLLNNDTVSGLFSYPVDVAENSGTYHARP